MNEDRTIKLVEIPIGGNEGAIWNRLHEEREDIREALAKDYEPGAQANKRQSLLQARLRRIDDALDRLMSGSYGICSNCGRMIEAAPLAIDMTGALCMDCWRRESAELPAGISAALHRRSA